MTHRSDATQGRRESRLRLHRFPSRQRLVRALVARVHQALLARLEKDGEATLAVSGGRTPAAFLEALSAVHLDWGKITVVLVDERWVPEQSPRSNAAFVRAHLLQRRAAGSRFISYYDARTNPNAAAEQISVKLRQAPLPLAAVVLGMGEDGHTASFFPDAENLISALSPHDHALVAVIRSAAAQEPRVTLTLPVIAAADLIALHIEGPEKKRVLDRARRPGPDEELPIRAVFRTAPRPIEAFWSAER